MLPRAGYGRAEESHMPYIYMVDGSCSWWGHISDISKVVTHPPQYLANSASSKLILNTLSERTIGLKWCGGRFVGLGPENRVPRKWIEHIAGAALIWSWECASWAPDHFNDRLSAYGAPYPSCKQLEVCVLLLRGEELSHWPALVMMHKKKNDCQRVYVGIYYVYDRMKAERHKIRCSFYGTFAWWIMM